MDHQKLIEFTRKLIQTPSPSGREEEIANIIALEMKALGIKDVRVDEKNNVIGVIRGSGASKNLLYNGHIDHADTGSMENPYAGAICEGERFGVSGQVISGRGACDMKAAVAAMVYAGAELQRQAAALPCNVVITAVALEEQARGEGILHYLKNTDTAFDYAVSGEATDLELHLGHRGKLEYLIKVFGATAHSSNPSRGINAIFSMNKFLSAVEQEYALTLPAHDFLGQATVTVIDILAKPGRLTPIVPDYCELVLDRRYLPGEDSATVKGELVDLCRRIREKNPSFQSEIELIKDFPLLYCPPEEPVVNSARLVIEKVLGRTPALKAWQFGVDGAFISRQGIPCIGFGPGSELYAHTPQDHVKIDHIIAAAEVYAQLPHHLS